MPPGSGGDVPRIEARKLKCVRTPVDKNGEGINDADAQRTCHQVTGLSLDARPSAGVSTQCRLSRFALKKPKLLCVPSSTTTTLS